MDTPDTMQQDSTPFVSDDSAAMLSGGGGSPSPAPSPNPAPAPAPAPDPSAAPAFTGYGAEQPFSQPHSAPYDVPTPGAPAPAQPTRLQNFFRIVADGLAGGAGAKNFAQGVAGGARYSAAHTQEDVENRQKQQQINQVQHFQDAESAYRAAQLTNQDKQLAIQTQEAQDRHATSVMSLIKMNQDMFGMSYDAIPNSGEHAMNWITANRDNAQASGGRGATVPPGILITPSTIYVPKSGASSMDTQYKRAGMLSSALNLPAPTQQQFGIAGQGGRDKMLERLQTQLLGNDPSTGEAYDAAKLPSIIAATKTNIDTYGKQSDHDETILTTMKNTASNLQAQLDATNKNRSDVAASTATAMAKAEQPFKQAQAKFEQYLKDGDPAAAGQMLAVGDISPSQVRGSRNPRFALEAEAAAKKVNPGWNAQKADADFNVAKAPANAQFFGNANSLLDQGGTLDQLAAQYKKLPNGQVPAFNKLADWTAAAAGSGSTAGYAQTAIGVADDYAKIMGGGQGTDSARDAVLKSFSMAHSQPQMDAAIGAARSAVKSQRDARIGRNPVLQRMYGEQTTSNSVAPNSKGARPVGW